MQLHLQLDECACEIDGGGPVVMGGSVGGGERGCVLDERVAFV